MNKTKRYTYDNPDNKPYIVTDSDGNKHRLYSGQSFIKKGCIGIATTFTFIITDDLNQYITRKYTDEELKRYDELKDKAIIAAMQGILSNITYTRYLDEKTIIEKSINCSDILINKLMEVEL